MALNRKRRSCASLISQFKCVPPAFYSIKLMYTILSFVCIYPRLSLSLYVRCIFKRSFQFKKLILKSWVVHVWMLFCCLNLFTFFICTMYMTVLYMTFDIWTERRRRRRRRWWWWWWGKKIESRSNNILALLRHSLELSPTSSCSAIKILRNFNLH